LGFFFRNKKLFAPLLEIGLRHKILYIVNEQNSISYAKDDSPESSGHGCQERGSE